MRIRTILLSWVLIVPSPVMIAANGSTARVPTIDDLLMVKGIVGAEISPGGGLVAYTVTGTDFSNDEFVSQIWIVRASDGVTYQLTQGSKSVQSPRWSPDGKWLAFTSNRAGDKKQLFLIRPDGGEATRLTNSSTDVEDYAWSPDSSTIAFVAAEGETQAQKLRTERFGSFEVVRREYVYSRLWAVHVPGIPEVPAGARQRTSGRKLHVGKISWAPDARRIAFSATTSPDLIDEASADIYVLRLEDDLVQRAVALSGPDDNPRWSPDGSKIAFESAMGRPDFYQGNSCVAIVSATGGAPVSVTDSFDELPKLLDWTTTGLYFFGLQQTASHLFQVDPSGNVLRVSNPEMLAGFSFSLSADTERIAFVAASNTSLAEVFVSSGKAWSPRRLTRMTVQVNRFELGVRELVSWKSKDGTTIEGVLVKPARFDPAKRYPLLVEIHGGPTATDVPALLDPYAWNLRGYDTRYYPTDVWTGRGALVLKVNYRGSSGYGKAFRQLNVRNLGIGDAWDVLSGVDYLVGKGWVDPARVACMGWSQGGYIAAFLATTTNRFAAISVGAGISNWRTYYYGTNSTPFTLNYLGNNPAEDPEIYQRTSPMSYITKANTPTLIQHGEFDRRVPIANAYELRQGLDDQGVTVEMIVYKGIGHGPSKPRVMRAVMQHNLDWFDHYLWKEPAADFANPSLNESSDYGRVP